jgi:hypothetical protein
MDGYVALAIGIESVMEKRRVAMNDRTRIDSLAFTAVVRIFQSIHPQQSPVGGIKSLRSPLLTG